MRIIDQGAMETEELDLLGDARKRVHFVTDLKPRDSSILDVLRRVDKSFVSKKGRYATAINDKGIQVDIQRRQPVTDDPHTLHLADDEDDRWPVEAVRSCGLPAATTFEHLVVGATGRMAMMRTVSPTAFVEFKRWMKRAAPGRAEAKQRRNSRQADIVQQLLAQRLLMS